jgi:hypothetical protein
MAIKVSGTTVINDSRALENITDIPNIVRAVTVTTPANGSTDTGVGKNMTLTASAFEAVFGISDGVQFQIDNNSDFSSPIYDATTDTSGATVTIDAAAAGIPTNTTLYIRARYRDTQGTYSDWSSANSFTSRSSFDFVTTPSITDPTVAESFTPSSDVFNSSAFATSGGSYTHTSSSWQVASDSAFNSIVHQITEDTSNLTSWDGGTGNYVAENSYYVRVKHHNSILGESDWSAGVVFNVPLPTGEQSYTSPGNYTFTVPAGVTSVSAVVVGGGGCGEFQHDGANGGGGALGYKNNISVTPGSSISVSVGAGGTGNGDGGASSFGTLSAQGGRMGGAFSAMPNDAIELSEITSPSYGRIAVNSNADNSSSGKGGAGFHYSASNLGGSGAGGYSGNGGHGNSGYGNNSNQNVTSWMIGTGGAGGGGHANSSVSTVGGGGGVGIFGEGPSGGTEGTSGSRRGFGGSGGTNGNASTGNVAGSGGLYGGGGGGGYSYSSPTVGAGGAGGKGAVRIIWGPNRSFPNNAS